MKTFYLGENNKTIHPTDIYYGVSNIPKRVKKIYFGINQKAKLIYQYNYIEKNIAIINSNLKVIKCSYIKQNNFEDYNINVADPLSQIPIFRNNSDNPQTLKTSANKIKIIDSSSHNSNGIFSYNNGSSAYNDENIFKRYPLNLDHFIFNELTNFNKCFSNRILQGNISNVNFNNGNFFDNCFYNSEYSDKGTLKIKLNTFYYRNFFTNCRMPYVNLEINAIMENRNFSISASRLLVNSEFNSVTIIGNLDTDYEYPSGYIIEDCYKINKIKGKLNLLSANGFISNSNTYLELNINSGPNVSHTFANFSGGGYIYLNFPNTEYNVYNFITYRRPQNRNFWPTENFYIYIKEDYKINHIKKNIFLEGTEYLIDFSSTGLFPMPDNNKKLYNCYYNLSYKLFLLYGDPIINQE